jgi:hypothetical protein
MASGRLLDDPLEHLARERLDGLKAQSGPS